MQTKMPKMPRTRPRMSAMTSPAVQRGRGEARGGESWVRRVLQQASSQRRATHQHPFSPRPAAGAGSRSAVSGPDRDRAGGRVSREARRPHSPPGLLGICVGGGKRGWRSAASTGGAHGSRRQRGQQHVGSSCGAASHRATAAPAAAPRSPTPTPTRRRQPQTRHDHHPTHLGERDEGGQHKGQHHRKVHAERAGADGTGPQPEGPGWAQGADAESRRGGMSSCRRVVEAVGRRRFAPPGRGCSPFPSCAAAAECAERSGTAGGHVPRAVPALRCPPAARRHNALTE